MLEIKNAAVGYGSELIWQKVNLHINPGAFIAIVGPNGSGKSSFLRAIAGLVPLRHGEILFKGSTKRHATDISYVPQHIELNRQLPLRGKDFVKLGLDGHHWGISSLTHHRWHQAEIHTLLAMLEADSYADQNIVHLSGGQLQRLRVAQGLICGPELLLCDESLASLDPHSQQVIAKTIHTFQRKNNSTVLFVSHEMEALIPYVDHTITIENGKAAFV